MTTEKRKPKNPITKIRTGTGDEGFTYFRGNEKTPKSSVWIEYLGLLDLIQSKTLDTYVQNLMFALGANANNPYGADQYIDQIESLIKHFETIVTEGVKNPDLKALGGFIRTTKVNKSMMELRAIVRLAEQKACSILFNEIYGIAYLSYEEEATIKRHIKALNVLSDACFYLAWWLSSVAAGEKGQLYIWDGKNNV